MTLPSLPSESPSQSDAFGRRSRIVLSGASLFLGLAVLAMVLYLDRDNHVSLWINSLGPLGIVVAILLMALVCLTPLPGEFLLLMDMRIYGVWLGIGVGWIGSIVGALVAFVLARSAGRALIGRFVTPTHLQTVEGWVAKSNVFGLLAVRLLPLPSSAVNYALGMLHAVSLWSYFWTGAVTAVPYYACTGLVYVGVFQRWTAWSVIALIAIAAAWLLGMVGKRIWKEYSHKRRNT